MFVVGFLSFFVGRGGGLYLPEMVCDKYPGTVRNSRQKINNPWILSCIGNTESLSSDRSGMKQHFDPHIKHLQHSPLTRSGLKSTRSHTFPFMTSYSPSVMVWSGPCLVIQISEASGSCCQLHGSSKSQYVCIPSVRKNHSSVKSPLQIDPLVSK